ncbi:MAG: BadF/BadG/BcrA/BcrD ATPase family protein [Candidatus Faecousia sp.]|nr:BadF/BadG/BcrA/BcrD ATPase family protein [Candidatus Faecousia sp.]
MFVAGIDGGGTHTRLELRDGENRLLHREEFGPFNLNAIGEAAFRQLLAQVFAACGDMTECVGLCVGGAGVSNPALGEILSQELKKARFHGSWKLCGDQEIALRGAMEGPGIIVIAGTGSICFGKNALGQTARSGGYGHLIDDGGSGYALGRDVLSAAVRQCDGRNPERGILDEVYRRLGKETPEAIVSFVYSPKTDKAALARFSSVALTLAEQGDSSALEILEAGAGELYELVAAVQRRLNLAGCTIALLGGLLTGDNAYRRRVAGKLSGLGRVVPAAHDALWGAAQMAWELSQAEKTMQ